MEERRAVERLATRARHLVARAALAAGDLATGVEAAEQALDEDAYDEESFRLVMAALAAQGQVVIGARRVRADADSHSPTSSAPHRPSRPMPRTWPC